MPELTKFTRHTIKVEPVIYPSEEGVTRMWRFAMKCQATGNEKWIEFSDEVRDEIVKALTGGIVIPDGSRPIDQFRADEG